MRHLLGLAMAMGCGGGGFYVELRDAPARCYQLEDCPLAVGGTAHLEVLRQEDDVAVIDERFFAVVDDPARLRVERVEHGLELTGLAPGLATVRLEHEELDMTETVVVPIADVARTAIVPEMAEDAVELTGPLHVLHDSRVVLEAHHYDAGDRELAGRGLDTWTITGATTATLTGDETGSSRELVTAELESFAVSAGATELPVIVVAPTAVAAVELIAIDGRGTTAKPNQTLRVFGRYTALLHAAAYDAEGAYIAGAGLPEDFSVTGQGIRTVDRARRRVVVEPVATVLDIRVGAAAGRFAIEFP